MHNTLRLAARVRAVSGVYAFHNSLAQPRLSAIPPHHLPTLGTSVQLQVARFGCGCPEGGSEKLEVEVKSKKSKGKGSGCSEFQGGENELMEVKSKGKKRGGKAKSKGSSKGDGGQSGEKRKYRKQLKQVSLCDIPKHEEDISKAKTVICEGYDYPPSNGPVEKCTDKSSQEKCSSSSSSDSSCSSSTSDSSSDGSGSDEIPKKQCPGKPLDAKFDVENNEKSAAVLCSCIQNAIANSKPKPKESNYMMRRKAAPKKTQGRPKSCGPPPELDNEPKFSEHVQCCEAETSKTSTSKGGLSGAEYCKLRKEKEAKEAAKKAAKEDYIEDEDEGDQNEPCECIKRVLEKCKQGKKVQELEELISVEDDKCGTRDKPDMDEFIEEDESPKSQCPPKKSGRKG